MTVTTSNARHVLFRLSEPARLPDSLLGTLRDEVVLAGWMRASGVLHDVRLRSPSGTSVRGLVGSVQVIALEGSIALVEGDVACGLRAVLARETDTGLETIAGEIVDARVGALEVMVTAFDEVSATHQAGVWDVRGQGAPAAAAPEPEAPAAMPLRPVKPKVEEVEQVYPDAGDTVEHFAFGRCEVVKSDGDRLHLRLGKDGHVKEIALEMLRVTSLPPVDGTTGRYFRLDRKL